MFSAVLREFHRRPKRPLPPLSDAYLVSPLVAKLRETWHQLHDIDRALAVREIVQLGVSRRRVARELGFSEGLMRHLLKALEAMPSDIELAGQNAISTNELIRRVRGTSTRRSAPEKDSKLEHAEPEPEFTTDSAEVSRQLLNWLATDKDRANNAYMALTMARIQIREAMKRGRLPARSRRAGVSMEEIIRSYRPDPTRYVLPSSWYADWVLSWVFHLLPNPKLCRNALDMAWSRVRFRIGQPKLW